MVMICFGRQHYYLDSISNATAMHVCMTSCDSFLYYLKLDEYSLQCVSYLIVMHVPASNNNGKITKVHVHKNVYKEEQP